MNHDIGIKVFSDNLYTIYGLRSGSAIQTLFCLFTLLQYNTCTLFLTAADRAYLEKKTGLSATSLSRALSALESAGAICRGEYADSKGNVRILRGAFIINPKMFWLGDIEERKVAMSEYGHYFGY